VALDPGIQSGVTAKVVSQLSSKTVGPPLTTTGLTGDKTPDTILQVSDFDKVKNQINIELANLEVLERLNQIGQITNKQSQSGPIGGTMKMIQKTYTSTDDDEDFFKPTEGVWQLLGGDTLSSGGTGSINWSYTDDNDVYSFIFKTSVNGQEPIFQDSQNNNIGHALYITPECWLHANIISVATSIRPTLAFIRVR